VVEAAGTSIARTASYEYDFQGKRWKTTTPEGSMSTNQSHVLIVQERNAGHTPQVTYTRGLDLSGSIEGAGGIGGLLMRSHGYSGGNWSTHNAYHSDANGNVTALMSSAGVLQASYKYNPYGGLISSSGSLAGANTMRFSSKPAILSATGAWGFYYYGYRFYDPGMQRWLNRDPLGEEGAVNLYSFVAHGPLNWIDPDGRAIMPMPSIPYHPPSYIPPRYSQGFSLCQRDLQKDSSCDCPTMIGNALGGEHSYLQYVDGEGNKWGWGFASGGTTSEGHFNPNSCKPCKKTGTLKSVSGGGNSASSATDAEIQDCIKTSKPSKPYSTFRYNCRDWAKEAAKKCGLDCN